jgi:hypothetical protein
MTRHLNKHSFSLLGTKNMFKKVSRDDSVCHFLSSNLGFHSLITSSYLDDTFAFLPYQYFPWFLWPLMELGPNYGIHLNLSKTFYSPPPQAP